MEYQILKHLNRDWSLDLVSEKQSMRSSAANLQKAGFPMILLFLPGNKTYNIIQHKL